MDALANYCSVVYRLRLLRVRVRASVRASVSVTYHCSVVNRLLLATNVVEGAAPERLHHDPGNVSAEDVESEAEPARGVAVGACM